MSCRLQPWVPEVEADQVELPEVGTVAAVAVEEVKEGEVMPIEVTFLGQKVWPRWAKENTWIDLVNYMKLNNLLPAVVFVF